MITFIKKHFITFILVIILLSGLSLLLYPTLSNIWNSYHQSEAIASYKHHVADMKQSKEEEMLSAAHAYNKTLATGVTPLLNLTKSEIETYNHILDVTGTGIMAYVEIPKLKTTMPIYHGTDEAIIEIAIGHIPGTSFPVGGKGTHSVISGHRGLPSANLFTNLNYLKNGDRFMIHVLGETLTYKVDQILTVKPEEISALKIDPNRDYCTLVTCTPYGVNTHRLLVRGHRVVAPKTSKVYKSISSTNLFPIVGWLTGTFVLILTSWGLYFHHNKKTKRLWKGFKKR